MPAFATPGPITVTARVGAGSLHVAAGDRTETVVEVLPRDPEKDKDVRAAGQTEVGFADGLLTIRTQQHPLIGATGAVDVTVGLPAGSHLEVTGDWTRVVGEGRLGEVTVKTSSGDVRLETTGSLRLRAAHGSITVGRVEGTAEITTSSGSLRVGVLDGAAVLKNSHGATSVGSATGGLRVSGANGDIDITRAAGPVTATTAHGALRVTEVAAGDVELTTGYGSIDVGVRAGTAAWLDVGSEHGRVSNALAGSAPPEGSEESVTIRARTRWGSIDVHPARS